MTYEKFAAIAFVAVEVVFLIWMLIYLNKGKSKRELLDELRYQKEMREQDERAWNKVIEDLKTRNYELRKQVEFYKAESGYYKGQAEKNLELLGKALENGKQKHNV